MREFKTKTQLAKELHTTPATLEKFLRITGVFNNEWQGFGHYEIFDIEYYKKGRSRNKPVRAFMYDCEKVENVFADFYNGDFDGFNDVFKRNKFVKNYACRSYGV